MPSGNYTQKDVAVFIVDLDTARADCKSKLGSVKALLDKQKHNK